MSECPGLLTAIFGPVADAVAEHSRRRQLLRQQQQQQPLSPAEKAVTRAVVGAVVLTACLWVSPLMARNFSAYAGGACAFVALAALVALIAGLKESRGAVPTDLLAAFWSACVILGFGWLLFAGMVPPDAAERYIVRGLYVAGLAGAAVAFWIYAGFGQGNALRKIERQLERENAPMRPVRRH